MSNKNNVDKKKKLQKYLCLFLALIIIAGTLAGTLAMFASAAEFMPTLGSGHTISPSVDGEKKITISVKENKAVDSNYFTTKGTYSFKVSSANKLLDGSGAELPSTLVYSINNSKIEVGGISITKFIDNAASNWAENDIITLNITGYTGSQTSSEPIISNRKITYPGKSSQPSYISRGRRADVSMTVTDTNVNVSDYIGNAKVMLLSGSSFKFDEKSDTDIIKTVDSQGFLSFDITFKDVVYTGLGNSIKFRLIYDAKYNTVTYDKDVVFTEYRFMEYKEPSSSGGSSDNEETKIDPILPHMIVDSYDYGNESVVAGQTVKLTMSIKNTSHEYNLENIIMKITPPESFSIASASNTFYIESLAKGEIFEKEIEIQVKANATPESHNIAISFDYQYVANDKRIQGPKDEESIAIPVVQIDRFSINKVDAPATLYIGEEYPMSASLINKGKSPVYNVVADFKTANGSQNQSQFIGNIESGKEASADFFISAKEVGDLKGQVIISYEDSNLNTKTIVKDILVVIQGDTFNPVDPGIQDPTIPDEPVVPTDTKPNNTIKYVMIFCGIVIAGLSAYSTVMKIKMQRSEFEDEDIWFNQYVLQKFNKA